MKAEMNKTVVRQSFDALTRGRVDTLDTFLAPNYIAHFASIPAPMSREDFKQFITAFIATSPTNNTP